ncbi:hypothetical protein HJC23_005484 [Cyclotella cryptica]|uniref:Protein priA n=1 Tax=Cyclotella cryptica TaxID=29204 RepID=A0ABD3PFW3_9STRA|eukprot:CCRYP_014855-RA/>CCRYP_014855-RA protein AED:0.04 eAED:0.04 QI:116/1/1/1/1/1/2/225/205
MKFSFIAQAFTSLAVASTSAALNLDLQDMFDAIELGELDGDDDIVNHPCFDKAVAAANCGIDAGADDSIMQTCALCIASGIENPLTATCDDVDCASISECLSTNCAGCEDSLNDLFSCLLTDEGCATCSGEEDTDIDTPEFLDVGRWACRDGSFCRRDSDCPRGGCSFRPPNRNRGLTCRNGDRCTRFCADGSACRRRNGLVAEE